jgi:hypothetical protein
MQLLLAAIACALCASVSTAFINSPLISTALTCSRAHTASRHDSCIVRSAAAASSSQDVQEAKAALSTALKQNGGDTKNDAVLQAVDCLVALQQPIDLSADSMWEKLDGDHLATGYNFPTGEFAHGGWSLTLGQLAFNLFEPTKLPVVVTSTVNTLAPLPQGDDDSKGELKVSRSIMLAYMWISARSPRCMYRLVKHLSTNIAYVLVKQVPDVRTIS